MNAFLSSLSNLFWFSSLLITLAILVLAWVIQNKPDIGHAFHMKVKVEWLKTFILVAFIPLGLSTWFSFSPLKRKVKDWMQMSVDSYEVPLPEEGAWTIGSGPESTLTLLNHKASPVHMSLTPRGEHLYLVNRSKNKMIDFESDYVNKWKLEPGQVLEINGQKLDVRAVGLTMKLASKVSFAVPGSETLFSQHDPAWKPYAGSVSIYREWFPFQAIFTALLVTAVILIAFFRIILVARRATEIYQRARAEGNAEPEGFWRFFHRCFFMDLPSRIASLGMVCLGVLLILVLYLPSPTTYLIQRNMHYNTRNQVRVPVAQGEQTRLVPLLELEKELNYGQNYRVQLGWALYRFSVKAPGEKLIFQPLSSEFLSVPLAGQTEVVSQISQEHNQDSLVLLFPPNFKRTTVRELKKDPVIKSSGGEIANLNFKKLSFIQEIYHVRLLLMLLLLIFFIFALVKMNPYSFALVFVLFTFINMGVVQGLEFSFNQTRYALLFRRFLQLGAMGLILFIFGLGFCSNGRFRFFGKREMASPFGHLLRNFQKGTKVILIWMVCGLLSGVAIPLIFRLMFGDLRQVPDMAWLFYVIIFFPAFIYAMVYFLLLRKNLPPGREWIDLRYNGNGLDISHELSNEVAPFFHFKFGRFILVQGHQGIPVELLVLFMFGLVVIQAAQGGEVGIQFAGVNIMPFEFGKFILACYLGIIAYYSTFHKYRFLKYALVGMVLVLLSISTHESSPIVLFGLAVGLHQVFLEEKPRVLVVLSCLLGFAGWFVLTFLPGLVFLVVFISFGLVFYRFDPYPHIQNQFETIRRVVKEPSTWWQNFRDKAKLDPWKTINLASLFAIPIGAVFFITAGAYVPDSLNQTGWRRLVNFSKPWKNPDENYQFLASAWLMQDAGLLGGQKDTKEAIGFVPGVRDDFALSLFVAREGQLGLYRILGAIFLLLLTTFLMFQKWLPKSKNDFGGPPRWRTQFLFLVVVFCIQLLIPLGSVSGILPIMGQPFAFISYSIFGMVFFALPIFGYLISMTFLDQDI